MVSMNLSAKELQHPTLIQSIIEGLQGHGTDPRGIELEITENAVMQYDEFTLTKLEKLKELGLALAIDDFGTGFSSLSHLNRLPIDTLKIDKSFIEALENDPKAIKITAATISLAKTLDMKVVGEGVETAEQLARLQELGCELAQGNHISKPLPSEDASALIAASA